MLSRKPGAFQARVEFASPLPRHGVQEGNLAEGVARRQLLRDVRRVVSPDDHVELTLHDDVEVAPILSLHTETVI